MGGEMIKDILRKFALLTTIALAVIAVVFQLHRDTEAPAQAARAQPSASGVVARSTAVQTGETPMVPVADASPSRPLAAEAGGATLMTAVAPAPQPVAATAPGVATVAAPAAADAAAPAGTPGTARTGARAEGLAGSDRSNATATPSARVQGMDGQEIRAQLSPRRFTTLATEIGARIRSLPVGESARFRSGHLLVAFDCSIQKAQLDRSRAEMDATEKVLVANEQLDKFNSIGKVDLETSRSAFVKAKADVAVADAALKKCDIRAPYDGRIAELKVREQQYVQPGQPLMEIIDDSTLELEFIVPSRWMSWLKPGVPFRVTIDETGRSYPARFTRIGARVDAASMSVKVAGQIEGGHKDLVAGMSGVIVAHPPEESRPAAGKRRSAGVRAERTATEL